jgi:hypothetical protein
VTVCAEAHAAAVPPDKRPNAVCPVPENTLAAESYQSAYAELSKLEPPRRSDPPERPLGR